MISAASPFLETKRLQILRSYSVLDTAAEAAFDELVELAAKVTQSPIALASFVDADRQWFKAKHGLCAVQTHLDEAACAHAILQPHQMLIIEDATTDSRFADSPLVTGASGIRFYAAAPLISKEGLGIGTLCVMDHVPRRIGERQCAKLLDVARTVSVMLEVRRVAKVGYFMAMTGAQPRTSDTARRMLS
ncbi:GAF domain-containing protein [Paracraurococcus ruber]|uniref:GAF domain-containing protein n=1 Tax=Paracraurococcus ruber TaxID=77675 RepID=A0ABS1D3Q6_9PROT|nr:GAF domain-containing protein [Paracraurococcus ruber]MBK1661493.1 hypothetical protein [Paracraurococcus ruber]TDG28332.1 GAF domain-containing protein [Paracraurococcus ruber]